MSHQFTVFLKKLIILVNNPIAYIYCFPEEKSVILVNNHISIAFPKQNSNNYIITIKNFICMHAWAMEHA